MARHPALQHLDNGAPSGCSPGTLVAFFVSGTCVAEVPAGAEIFICNPATGKVLRRVNGGDNLTTLLAPVL